MGFMASAVPWCFAKSPTVLLQDSGPTVRKILPNYFAQVFVLSLLEQVLLVVQELGHSFFSVPVLGDSCLLQRLCYVQRHKKCHYKTQLPITCFPPTTSHLAYCQ